MNKQKLIDEIITINWYEDHTLAKDEDIHDREENTRTFLDWFTVEELQWYLDWEISDDEFIEINDKRIEKDRQLTI